MSIRDGLEPSRSPDSDTETRPLPTDGPGRPEGGPTGPEAQPAQAFGPEGQRLDPAGAPDPRHDPAAPEARTLPADVGPDAPTAPGTRPADPAWPPSWGEAPPPSQGGWPAPAAAAQDPTRAPSPTPQEQAAQGPSWSQPPAGQEQAPQGPSWTHAPPVEAPADRTQPGWGQGGGGGGYPTMPQWGERPAGPRDRRPSRVVAAGLAAVLLLAGGYGISQALDDDPAAPGAAGIPTAAAPSAPAASPRPGEEPAAAVARALLPTVVEIRRGASGIGSGFVYDRRGFIMTAAHVVEGTDQVDVRLYDGTRLRGEVLGTDDANDVAVVKVDRENLPAAPLAVGQTLQVGQLAVAIGSPFGLAETVTAGIVSSTDRILEDGREVIQTDAPINPGNSGGVLADRQGRVIGINSAIRSDGTNGNVGIGFAVPIDLAAKSAEAIVQGRPVETGYLGVTTAPTTVGGQAGALISQVTADSPAEEAGLRAGDVVVAIDGQAIESFSELAARIRAHKPGDRVELRVVRGGDQTTVTATLTQRPAG
jgi:S1-C subfamily serine protease